MNTPKPRTLENLSIKYTQSISNVTHHTSHDDLDLVGIPTEEHDVLDLVGIPTMEYDDLDLVRIPTE
jgi:hypothetical protein